jgi:hypothetical protein
MDDDFTKFMRAYVRNCAPVQWVAWLGHVTDPLVKQQLYDILFDSGADALRDLTQPQIRDKVTDLVMSSAYLQDFVWEEMRPHVERLAQQEESEDESAT